MPRAARRPLREPFSSGTTDDSLRLSKQVLSKAVEEAGAQSCNAGGYVTRATVLKQPGSGVLGNVVQTPYVSRTDSKWAVLTRSKRRGDRRSRTQLVSEKCHDPLPLLSRCRPIIRHGFRFAFNSEDPSHTRYDHEASHERRESDAELSTLPPFESRTAKPDSKRPSPGR